MTPDKVRATLIKAGIRLDQHLDYPIPMLREFCVMLDGYRNLTKKDLTLRFVWFKHGWMRARGLLF